MSAFDMWRVFSIVFFLKLVFDEWGFLISLAGQHTWIFSEPDPSLEVSLAHPGGQTHRAFLQSALPGQWLAVLMPPCGLATRAA